MNEKEFIKRFIDFVYYVQNKSHWYLAIDNFLAKFHKDFGEFKFTPTNHNAFLGTDFCGIEPAEFNRVKMECWGHLTTCAVVEHIHAGHRHTDPGAPECNCGSLTDPNKTKEKT